MATFEKTLVNWQVQVLKKEEEEIGDLWKQDETLAKLCTAYTLHLDRANKRKGRYRYPFHAHLNLTGMLQRFFIYAVT